MIWLEFCMFYTYSCCHHGPPPSFLAPVKPANPGSPGQWPLNRRERELLEKCWMLHICVAWFVCDRWASCTNWFLLCHVRSISRKYNLHINKGRLSNYVTNGKYFYSLWHIIRTSIVVNTIGYFSADLSMMCEIEQREAATICPEPVTLTFWPWKWSESRVTWATSVPISIFLGLSVLDLGPMYSTDRQTSNRRQTASLLNAPA